MYTEARSLPLFVFVGGAVAATCGELLRGSPPGKGDAGREGLRLRACGKGRLYVCMFSYVFVASITSSRWCAPSAHAAVRVERWLHK